MIDGMDLCFPGKRMEQEPSAWMCDMEWTSGISYPALGEILYFTMTPKNSYGIFP